MEQEPTERLDLTLAETGTLCHLMMQTVVAAGTTMDRMPVWLQQLYTKLAEANDKLRGHH